MHFELILIIFISLNSSGIFRCAYCNTLWTSPLRMHAMLSSSIALPLWVLEQRVWQCVRCGGKSELCKTKIMSKEVDSRICEEKIPTPIPHVLPCLLCSAVYNDIRWTRVCKASWELQFKADKHTRSIHTHEVNTLHACTLHIQDTLSLGKVLCIMFVLLSTVQMLHI